MSMVRHPPTEPEPQKKPKFDMQFDINTIIEPPKDPPKLMIFNIEAKGLKFFSLAKKMGFSQQLSL